MAEVYIGLKWLHIVAVCIAFGSNITHIFWIVAANRDAAHRANILRLVKKIDDRLAVPAWALATVCGVVMWLWQWPVNSPWIIASLVVTLILTAMGIAFGPFMYQWIGLAKESDPEHPSLQVMSRRLTAWWIGITVATFIVLYLMVFKPALW